MFFTGNLTLTVMKIKKIHKYPDVFLFYISKKPENLRKKKNKNIISIKKLLLFSLEQNSGRRIGQKIDIQLEYTCLKRNYFFQFFLRRTITQTQYF